MTPIPLMLASALVALAAVASPTAAAAAGAVDARGETLPAFTDPNCSEEGGLASVNAWILSNCGEGPCTGSGSYVVNLWIANRGCSDPHWCLHDAPPVGERLVVLRAFATVDAPCGPEPLRYEVDAQDGRVSVWVLNS